MKLPRLALTLATPLAIAAALCGQNPTYWTTYFGGTGNDAVDQVVAAANGDILVAGTTESSDLPVPPTAYQPSRAGQYDVFVARLSADGTQILAATYLGGSARDLAYDLVEAGDGSIWVAGKSDSSDFPTTPDAYAQPSGSHDAFVAQLDAGLTNLQYATLLGHTGDDEARSLAVDDVKQIVYLAGLTASPSFPTTSSAFQSKVTFRAVFFSVLDRSVAGTTALSYSTTLNGSFLEEEVNGLTIDAAGVATVTGTTASSNFPTTADAFDTTFGGNGEGFVARIDPSRSGAASLLYSSYFGGSGYADAMTHAVDQKRIVHLLLISNSPDLPATANALQSTAGAGFDAFYAQLDPTMAGAAGLRYGTWIVAGNGTEGQGVGNPADNRGASIALTSSGVVVWVVTGSKAGVATTPGAFQPATGARRGHALVLDLSGATPTVAYATSFLGCSQNMFSGEVAVHPSGDLLLTGWGDHFPSTPVTVQPQLAGKFDGFVSRLDPAPWPAAVQVLGTSCAGTAGIPSFGAAAPPRLCKTMLLQATGLPPIRLGAMLFGAATPPIPLAAIGGGTCTLDVSPVITVPLTANGSGVASVSLGLPSTPTLLESPFAVQLLCTDPGANQLGMITTNALVLEARW